MRFAVVLALLVVVRSAYGYLELELVMQPDFSLYTQGGFGLYPSPAGRLLGAAGALPFALVSVAAAGVCVLAVALAARRRGFSPAGAALLFSLSPASLYLAYAGIDSIGLALLLLAVAGVGASWSLPLAALTHLSLVPFALLKLPRSLAARALFVIVAGCALLALALTPYAGVLTGLFHPDALEAMALGLGVVLLLSLPALLFVRRVPALWFVAAGVGVLECGLQHHLQARYGLPAAAVAAIHVERPAWARLPVVVRSGLHNHAMRKKMKPALSTPAPKCSDAIQARRAPSG